MASLLDNSFSVIEWLAVTGLAQSILIIVYIIFRVRHWRQAVPALAYFAMLAAAFCFQFALRLEDYEDTLRLLLWAAWAWSPALCYLLVLQVAKGGDLPEKKQFWVLAAMPAAAVAVSLLRNAVHICDAGVTTCDNTFTWLYWLGSVAGGIVMLALWAHKDIFAVLRKTKGGHERYWLVIMFVAVNVGAVAINLIRSMGSLDMADADALLVAVGLAFAYLASTTLFRVYPLPIQMDEAPTRFKTQALTAEETAIADRVKKLMEIDKLYHEPTFSRSDLARELGASESTLSRVINVAFNKSFPRMLNEYRVEDAKRLLQNKDIAIQVAAFEVGFNSLASFNRAFKEVTGETPSQYRGAQG